MQMVSPWNGMITTINMRSFHLPCKSGHQARDVKMAITKMA